MAADNAEVPADTPLIVYRAAERKLSVKAHDFGHLQSRHVQAIQLLLEGELKDKPVVHPAPCLTHYIWPLYPH